MLPKIRLRFSSTSRSELLAGESCVGNGMAKLAPKKQPTKFEETAHVSIHTFHFSHLIQLRLPWLRGARLNDLRSPCATYKEA